MLARNQKKKKKKKKRISKKQLQKKRELTYQLEKEKKWLESMPPAGTPGALTFRNTLIKSHTTLAKSLQKHQKRRRKWLSFGGGRSGKGSERPGTASSRGSGTTKMSGDSAVS